MEIFKLAESLGFKEDNNEVVCKMALLAKWLREVHKMHVYADCDRTGLDWYWSISLIDKASYERQDYVKDGYFNSYESTLEAGLKEALNLIK